VIGRLLARFRRVRVPAGPVPPENVRVQLADGTAVPCELSYGGLRDGLHTWTAAVPVQVAGGRFTVLCDRLPARTTIMVRVLIPPLSGS
jgi:hypothetical protein